MKNKTGKPAFQTGRYFKYAIGEIVLVVIGILIALQISNWNETRKLKQQEIFYYCKINEDLSNDLLNIERSLATLNERQISTNRFLINLLKIQEDKSVLLDDYLAAVRSYRFIPSKSAIIDITSSGKLENLKNQDLKNAILNYYSELDNAIQIIEVNQNLLTDSSRLINYTDFGIQEVPFYRDSYSKELQTLLKSVNWHRDPHHPIFIALQDEMNLTIIVCEREKQLINEMKKRAEDLIQKIEPFCF
ncbi:DUF6090 family protein [Winogradskyella aurantia]|uniref:Uncharacterized protein n=1 Tax=Winogradskyella aurantia TaxID=1915063 RepID=A0A265URW6_9FLAO|nr:DUF6090 family protein [Winogradskyella aurantia]OZV68063.1 hypothetical protein CA834_10475 [Winogradskyella aurantia]